MCLYPPNLAISRDVCLDLLTMVLSESQKITVVMRVNMFRKSLDAVLFLLIVYTSDTIRVQELLGTLSTLGHPVG